MGLGSMKSSYFDREFATDATEDVVAYDTEASGIDTWHDQILEFASVRADKDLVPISEETFRVRRLPYIVPAPEALDVTGFSLQSLDDKTFPTEYDAAQRITNLLKTPANTLRTYVHYNGLRFDGGLIRATMFRNLQDPYFQSGKQNTQVDVLNLCQLAVAGDPSALKIGQHADGRPNWKLESICQLNGIDIQAHNGLSDTKATLQLAKLIRQNAPWAWTIAGACGSAGRVETRLSALVRTPTIVWSFSHFGAADLAPSLVISKDDKRSYLLVDLRKSLQEVDLTRLPDLDSLEDRSQAGLRIVRASSCPLFVPEAELRRFGVEPSGDLLVAAAKVLARKDILDPLDEAFRSRAFPVKDSPSSEERLFDGFVSFDDKKRQTSFHAAQKFEDRCRIAFEDPRLIDFHARLISLMATRDLFGNDTSGLAWRYEERAAEAFSRPHAAESSRWMTLARAFPTASAEWQEWAKTTFALTTEMLEVLAPAAGPLVYRAG